YQGFCNCALSVSATTAPEASNNQHFGPSHFLRTTWTYPATNRLLFSGGAAFGFFGEDVKAEGVNRPEDIPILDVATGIAYNSQYKTSPGISATYGWNSATNFNGRFSVSYITGSHA